MLLHPFKSIFTNTKKRKTDTTDNNDVFCLIK